jgi:N-methylhydantoinase A
VLTIANLTMSSIIKKVSIARGYDPRDFALFCYGGGGPLHGIELCARIEDSASDRPAGAWQFFGSWYAAG